MAKITNEIIHEVKMYANKYPDLSQKDLARLVGISHGSVNNILNGDYDAEQKPVESQIPYEQFRKLVMCEEAVKEIFRNAKECFGDNDVMFIDYKVLSSILKRCLPEEFEERLNEINNGITTF